MTKGDCLRFQIAKSNSPFYSYIIKVGNCVIMGNFIAGMIAGFIAFSVEGSKLRDKIMFNIENKLNDNEGGILDGNERLDLNEGVSSSTKS